MRTCTWRLARVSLRLTHPLTHPPTHARTHAPPFTHVRTHTHVPGACPGCHLWLGFRLRHVPGQLPADDGGSHCRCKLPAIARFCCWANDRASRRLVGAQVLTVFGNRRSWPRFHHDATKPERHGWHDMRGHGNRSIGWSSCRSLALMCTCTCILRPRDSIPTPLTKPPPTSTAHPHNQHLWHTHPASCFVRCVWRDGWACVCSQALAPASRDGLEIDCPELLLV